MGDEIAGGRAGMTAGGTGSEAELRSGDEGLRRRPVLFVETPRMGELLPSWRGRWCSGSRTEERMGDSGGNASSRGFRGVRWPPEAEREGDPGGPPEGLSGLPKAPPRGDSRTWPEEAKPGMDWVRDMGGGSRLAAEREREWRPAADRGEAVRGR